MNTKELLRQLEAYEREIIELHENDYCRQKMTLWTPGGDLELAFRKFCAEIHSVIIRS